MLTYVIDVVLGLFVLLVTVPVAVLFVECVAALLPTPSDESEKTLPRAPKVVVLIPAYNEQAILGATLASLRPELGKNDRVLVVADNCTDRTADIARAEGAEVIERFDSQKRSKGYALDCGFEHLAKNPPDVVVVLDADCRVGSGTVRRLAEFAMAYGRPAQAQDALSLPATATPLSRVSALAFLVRNHVRSTGMQRLGLPCHLMGTGMALPWNVIRALPPAGSHLAEDKQMGLELVSRGLSPIYCSSACITSAPPKRSDAARSQRRRWEHGHMATLLEKGPALIARGALSRRWAELGMGLDLLVPPLALLAVLSFVSLLLGGVWGGLSGVWWPFEIATCAAALFTGGVLLAWLRFGRETLPARYAVMIPLYVAWKIPLYLSFVAHGAHPRWDRTERSTSSF